MEATSSGSAVTNQHQWNMCKICMLVVADRGRRTFTSGMFQKESVYAASKW